jgi:pimeloyl-ACP methyl ester carboxylesterase
VQPLSPSQCFRVGAALAAALALAGCAGNRLIPPPGFTDRIVVGDGFDHRVFSSLLHPGSGVLHVYLEGDGRAWLTRTTVSRDPTPTKPLMLELMAMDPNPSVYIGRPCYFGLADSDGCAPRFWTSHRYSAEVIASLQGVIAKLLAEGGYSEVALFGHSGGGTLATLLATRVTQTRALVTIAPNLDVASWTTLHGYTPLDGSIDPARSREFPRDIFQVHWIGSRDREIPADLLTALRPYLGENSVRVRDGFDHRCCWQELWPSQLVEIQTHIARADREGSPLASRTANFQETLP